VEVLIERVEQTDLDPRVRHRILNWLANFRD
jgi:hypothetical protein